MRLIDADDLRDIFLSETCLFTPNDVLDYIDSTCTVDAVPVVRCADCKYGEFVSWCSKYSCRKVEGFLNFHNFYCKDGARKEDAE